MTVGFSVAGSSNSAASSGEHRARIILPSMRGVGSG
jgi:hypothetical protein